VANVDLANIENPVMPDRDAWIQRLSMSHWSFDELSNGQCWAHIKTYV
jgi:hypothetical protein